MGFTPAAARYGHRALGYLDEHTRRRVAAVLLVIVIAVAALAVFDVGPFSDPPTQEELAQDTVERFFAAGAAGDFGTFCGLLTRPARNAIEVRAGALAAEQNLDGCVEVLDALVGDQLKGSRLRVTLSSVSGDRARVETELIVKGGRGPQQRTVLLETDDGEWAIYDPGFG